MNARHHLIKLIETFAEAKKLSPSRVGTMLFSSGAKYRQLVEGADINVGRLEAAVLWLDEQWPESCKWPEGLTRPSLKLKTEEAA